MFDFHSQHNHGFRGWRIRINGWLAVGPDEDLDEVRHKLQQRLKEFTNNFLDEDESGGFTVVAEFIENVPPKPTTEAENTYIEMDETSKMSEELADFLRQIVTDDDDDE